MNLFRCFGFTCNLLPVLTLFTLLRISRASNNSSLYPPLEVSVYEVNQDSVEIDWHSKEVSQKSLTACELVYGPLQDPNQLQVLSNFFPDGHTFRLGELGENVTYHFHMICYNGSEAKFESNILQFTTGSRTHPMNYIMPSSTFKNIRNSRDSVYSRDEDYIRPVRSSSVILGAVCGIVGFLIINVTIVMAVRKYSHRQMRRRRILEIEDRDYDEFPYLRGYE